MGLKWQVPNRASGAVAEPRARRVAATSRALIVPFAAGNRAVATLLAGRPSAGALDVQRLTFSEGSAPPQIHHDHGFLDDGTGPDVFLGAPTRPFVIEGHSALGW